MLLVDEAGNNLVGTRYKTDSIKVFTSEKNILEGVNEYGWILFDFYDLNSKQNVFLDLGNNDIDTLKLELETYLNDCWSVKSLERLYYNNRKINAISAHTYRVIK